jgi:hypothetical protein
MPGKSRRKRGRQPPARKTQNRRQSSDVEQAAVPAGSVVARAPLTAAPEASVSPKVAAARQAIRHPYIGTELRTIGTLAVLMLVVLVVLKLVLN